jgi:hypothetical protein
MTTAANIQTIILIAGIKQAQLEAFAAYVAEEQGCDWLVKRAPHSTGEFGYFQMGFNSEFSFLQVSRVQAALKGMGANTALCCSAWD